MSSKTFTINPRTTQCPLADPLRPDRAPAGADMSAGFDIDRSPQRTDQRLGPQAGRCCAPSLIGRRLYLVSFRGGSPTPNWRITSGNCVPTYIEIGPVLLAFMGVPPLSPRGYPHFQGNAALCGGRPDEPAAVIEQPHALAALTSSTITSPRQSASPSSNL
jgi:hypothetical protein